MGWPQIISRNGVLIPPERASVSIFNPAIYGAYGAYESLQVARGVVFALEEHLRRLEHSAILLDLPLPADLATIAGWCHEVLAANAASGCTLRLFMVGDEDGEPGTAFLWPQPPTVFPATYYTDGVPVITFEGHRFMPEAKSLNTLVSTMARLRAAALRAHEGLLHHDGFLTEGAVSNLFAVIDGVIVTPPTGTVLSGVTRDTVMRLALLNGLPIVERPLALTAVTTWRECFITSTSRHIMPVTSVDGRPVGDGRVGPLTRRLSMLFEESFAQAVSCAV